MPKLITIVRRKSVDAVVGIQKCCDQADDQLEDIPYFETKCILPERELGLFPRLICIFYRTEMTKLLLLNFILLPFFLAQVIHAIEIFVVLLFSKASEEVGSSALFEIFLFVSRFETDLGHFVERFFDWALLVEDEALF